VLYETFANRDPNKKSLIYKKKKKNALPSTCIDPKFEFTSKVLSDMYD
jgi:hypothetical protein